MGIGTWSPLIFPKKGRNDKDVKYLSGCFSKTNEKVFDLWLLLLLLWGSATTASSEHHIERFLHSKTFPWKHWIGKTPNSPPTFQPAKKNIATKISIPCVGPRSLKEGLECASAKNSHERWDAILVRHTHWYFFSMLPKIDWREMDPHPHDRQLLHSQKN